MDVAPWIRVFGAILDTVPSACYKSFGLRSIKDADVLSENINFSAQLSLGKGGVSKTDEFLEKFQKGGGSFPIQKFMLQIFAIINAS